MNLLTLLKSNKVSQHFMGRWSAPFEIVAAEIPSYQLIDGQQL